MTRIRSIELRLVAIPLVRPFRTSFGESTEKVCILARAETDGAVIAFAWIQRRARVGNESRHPMTSGSRRSHELQPMPTSMSR